MTYGAMAIGAPLGVLFYAPGLTGAGADRDGRGAGGDTAGAPSSCGEGQQRQTVPPFRAVLGRVWLYGMALAPASAGFGVIATFITLFYDAKGWDGAAFALTLLAARLSALDCCSQMVSTV